MLSGDNISSFAANAERTKRGARGVEGRAEAETKKKTSERLRARARHTKTHLGDERVPVHGDARVFGLFRGDALDHEFRAGQDVQRHAGFLRRKTSKGKRERASGESSGRRVRRRRRLFAQKVGRPPGARARVGVHSVPQPRFSVDYTPVVRHSDEERLRNRSSPCTAAPEPKVPRAFAAENEHAQTAKGTPLCKHRGMPSETLVRNSSHSSPRAFVSRASRREKRRATKNQPGDASERQKPQNADANASLPRKESDARLVPRAIFGVRLFARRSRARPSRTKKRLTSNVPPHRRPRPSVPRSRTRPPTPRAAPRPRVTDPASRTPRRAPALNDSARARASPRAPRRRARGRERPAGQRASSDVACENTDAHRWMTHARVTSACYARVSNARRVASRRDSAAPRRCPCFRLCFVAASAAIARGEDDRGAFAARARRTSPRAWPSTRSRRPRERGVARTHLSEHHLYPSRGLFRPAPLRPHRRGARGGPSRGGAAQGGGEEHRAPDGAARLESRATRHRTPTREHARRGLEGRRAAARRSTASRWQLRLEGGVFSARSAFASICALMSGKKPFRMGNWSRRHMQFFFGRTLEKML